LSVPNLHSNTSLHWWLASRQAILAVARSQSTCTGVYQVITADGRTVPKGQPLVNLVESVLPQYLDAPCPTYISFLALKDLSIIKAPKNHLGMRLL